MAGGMASLEAIAASPASLGVRPSSNKVLFVSSSGRWSMPIRWEGKTSSSWSRARARSVVMRALFSPVAMEWQECTTELEVDVPCSVAYQCYSERENTPKWMPMISAVKILEDKPDLSRWSMKYEVLSQNVEFSWLTQNMTPIKNQKIHWRSLEGPPNRGAVRFFPKSPSSCRVQMSVEYEVPEIFALVAPADETIHHLLVGCVFSTEVRFRLLRRAGFPFLIPHQGDHFDEWWLRSRKRVSKDGRKGFDTLVVLTAWEVWKEHNGRVFNRNLSQAWQLASHIRDEGLLWVAAGYYSLVDFLQ